MIPDNGAPEEVEKTDIATGWVVRNASGVPGSGSTHN